jgi:hypothetical protein
MVRGGGKFINIAVFEIDELGSESVFSEFCGSVKIDASNPLL